MVVHQCYAISRLRESMSPKQPLDAEGYANDRLEGIGIRASFQASMTAEARRSHRQPVSLNVAGVRDAHHVLVGDHHYPLLVVSWAYLSHVRSHAASHLLLLVVQQTDSVGRSFAAEAYWVYGPSADDQVLWASVDASRRQEHFAFHLACGDHNQQPEAAVRGLGLSVAMVAHETTLH